MQSRTLNGLIARRVGEVEVRRISPDDSNYFALLFDPEDEGVTPVAVVEIFTVGGSTPPNTHSHAHEFFYVLSGTGKALCDGVEQPIGKGDALMLRPGTEHRIFNTGPDKLYTLTFMVPNEGFAELIRAGERLELDADDLRILTGIAA
ncbi:cupin 2 domain-containing protein [Novosphingobium nitrogenifigens DSM 19370]|uniref:Cupin 2 domain-containing protein n=1 Tax=Novosphingobium nitrogenifigens DSM 19370 TaxID=983920 RepID=F1ZB58_9SPHN|nr:cupin domain-containing protein [Novosphingobium nitrogenifigens]EGD58075.1 cupin 2 domain-containing protein [Novosphingobium nitrogenifigens DSM 19370]